MVRILIRAAGAAILMGILLAGSLKLPYVDHSTIALLMVATVVGLAVLWGTVSALTAAVVGGFGYDYFYLPPAGIAIELPEHWISLSAFLFVAVSVGRLASRLKHLLDQRNSLTQLSLEPLCIAGLEGNLQNANRALTDLLGWSEAALKGKPFLDLVDTADRERTQAALRAVVQSQSPAEIDNRCLTKDGEVRWLHWRLAPPAPGASWFSAAARDITEEKWAHEKMRDLTDRVMTAQEDERRRIARELHDDVTQRLAALGIELGLMKNADEEPGSRPLNEDLTRLQNGVLALSEDVRTLSHSLHPSILEHSTLAVSIEMYCREFSQQSGIPVTFTARDVPDSIPRPVMVAFYRIVQESLRNVGRHSGATEVSVVLAGPDLALFVIDNGRGFDPSQAKVRPGLGLVGIEERARQIGATVTIDSMPGEGTRIAVRMAGLEKTVK
ncbi:MAG: PAS domain S-box protein [Acidobacteriota bacterium]|nr:PAS domain S-box protein [Acidobacteriota bacterium]